MFKERKEKEDLSLDKFSKLLKNPPQNVYVSIYTKERVEVEPVGHPSKKMTLKQVVEMMNEGFKRLDSKIDTGFKQINDRIDKVEQRLDYNNLKPLPKENR